MLYAHLVAVNKLVAKLSVGLMEVKAQSTGEQRCHLVNILAQLVDVACLTGIVSCGLNTTRGSLIALEADNIVSLPAVQ